ncbi:putative defense protein Hdd11-like [Rhipicephalus sanguineus]|uniref:Reelin domain-containing protein n=1 Tax=Rhipicephalus sanguineus TaxID=34632 RepID=A0A9D4PZJ2_RHISA|nr:putative defense protein Hdd11-like [Rhipicephalus sanguineus]KAH7961730.1 hypothetical protein HPB52_011604 [Rhipicephalus sanguineus]
MRRALLKRPGSADVLERMRQGPSQPFTLLSMLPALVLEAACFSTGAPASACKEMEPRHNFMPQNQHHDYQVTVERSHRHLIVRLASLNRSWPFKGFMMRGFRVKGNKSIFFEGVFESSSFYHYVACGESFNRSVITHNSPADKTLVVAIWRPEKLTEALIEVFFRATILQKFDTFWQNVDSNHILINSSSNLRGARFLLLQLAMALVLTFQH